MAKGTLVDMMQAELERACPHFCLLLFCNFYESMLEDKVLGVGMNHPSDPSYSVLDQPSDGLLLATCEQIQCRLEELNSQAFNK